MCKLTNQLPSLKKYGPSSTGVETAPGRIRTLSSKETAQKSYMIGKNKSHTRDNVEYIQCTHAHPIHSNRHDWLLSSKMAWSKTSVCEWCLRTVFIYLEDYHKSLKTAHLQRLAFRKQCLRSINIEYSQRFACNTHTHTHTHTDKLTTITLRLCAWVNY